MKTIRLDGVVGWEILAEDVARRIEGENHIELVLNSGGGDVLEGFAIYNLLKDFTGKIDVKVDFAASMASVIAMVGDTITMQDNSSIMMIHRPWGVAGGNSEDFRKQADNLDKMEDMLLSIYLSKSGMDREELSALLADETWMNAEEALSFGLITNVEGGKSDFAMVAMAGMKAHEKVDFSTDKFLAKIKAMKEGKPSKKNIFNTCKTITDVEVTIRNEFNLSRSEAQAICAAVRKHTQGDLEPATKEDLKAAFKEFLK